jgi:dTDP-4-amino-4,6-dideoxygalactose transaminase
MMGSDERKISMTETAPEHVQIPLFDLRLEREDIEAVAETLRSGWLTMGPRTQAFEEAFAEHLGVRHAIAVSSCTAALHLAYLAAGVGPGDEVIVPSFTFAATAAAVVYCGGTPVFADITSLEEPSIDPVQVERLIGPRTKAIGAVHFAGYAAPVDVLRRICDEHGIALIEDAAHAPSALLHGRKLGTFGLAGCFSLFSNKVLSVGEGGLITTDDDEVAELARLARSQGMTSGTWDRHSGRTDTYDVVRLGWNYRLDEPRSALAHSRLRRLDADIAKRRELVGRYRELLTDVDRVVVPYRDDDVGTSTCYVMPVMVDGERRDAARTRLRDHFGVQTSIFYPAVHEFTVYRERYPTERLPVTEQAARSEITLPLFPHMTAAEQERVVSGLTAALER